MISGQRHNPQKQGRGIAQLIGYYAKRAKEYEEIYQKPERQEDLSILRDLVLRSFPNDNVLDIACGTGYWTQLIAKTAKRIVAVDCNSEVIDIARKKMYGDCDIEFVISDAYSLSNIPHNFSAGFLGFWWSHIPVQRQAHFLSLLHSHLLRDSKVIIVDNCYVENGSTKISRTDEFGNSFQMRSLKDGSKHEVLKNFPSDGTLISALSPFSNEVNIKRLKYYWIAEYKAK